MTPVRASEAAPRPTPSVAGFGSLVDLALVTATHSTVEVCGLCSTANRLHSKACKCCGYRFPASYASARPRDSRWTARVLGIVRGEGFDVVALCLVIYLLLSVARFIPAG
ncbi:hypothetical protein [Variovorax ginsengisoli]|uniref:Uncharacterized protein n=1 Tax=Variovorax ginsengisoli TaxID=363844 RepID=A0ABT8S8J7_9BURK|nr:hypothetical protein [Variovorax ginsengisoli]MDN8616058.1 hypothetical protein [Variovorax ginsengisoli]MDO1535228.1 hypothetical protein [Variovorax ginsengisoli]